MTTFCPLNMEFQHAPSAILTIPVELSNMIYKDLDEASLSNLARTCQFLHEDAEPYRFVRAQLNTKGAVESFCVALMGDRGIERAQRLRQLSVEWSDSQPPTPYTIGDVDWIIAHTCNVTTLSLYMPPPHLVPSTPRYPFSKAAGRLSLHRLAALTTLRINVNALRILHRPPPQLTTLTLNGDSAGRTDVLAAVGRIFGDTIRNLHIHRSLRYPWTCQSPVRVCAALQGCRALEYLEIRDEVPEDCLAPLQQLDIMDDPSLPMLAAEGTPNLETLVWSPAWRPAYRLYHQQFLFQVGLYAYGIVHALAPITLYTCTSNTEGIFLCCQSEDERFGGAIPVPLPFELE